MLYFAYGSNMWLEQMALRCPDSTYVGRGILYDYRWQINERGYANVVHVPPHQTIITGRNNDGNNRGNGHNEDYGGHRRPCVHGLVYDLGSETANEHWLDRYEGVRTGAYSKAYLDVELYAAPPQLQVPAESVLVHLEEQQKEAGRANSNSIHTDEAKCLERDVLVYLSETYTQPALARTDYVVRMAHAVRDALALGMPRSFVEEFIVPTMATGFLDSVGLGKDMDIKEDADA
ncbi:hypothetical protein SCUCBS95973_000966 [Sporothrix curviconia]|uniref:gamma-glutamylcyclotransferase n=1 Tax=Sporothrix curviconia TaxID=1260050 RepID=A0ABP0AUM2_9PEZI